MQIFAVTHRYTMVYHSIPTKTVRQPSNTMVLRTYDLDFGSSWTLLKPKHQEIGLNLSNWLHDQRGRSIVDRCEQTP